MLKIVKKLFGTSNERRVKTLIQRVEQRINPLEAGIKALSDDALRAKTDEFKARLASGATLDDILDEAFAVVREAASRAIGQRHYDVQLVGGMVLNSGAISEMRTGEGKTLVATAPVYLNALTGRGVHVVTVNDYLAKRDAEWMGRIYAFLGMETGVIVPNLDDATRRINYAKDITYGTNNEFGFDYLRDNLKYSLDEMVQRDHHFAIVDEVDSILIDEARTPLIISGPTDDRSDFYRSMDELIYLLDKDDYEHDEKQRSAVYTEKGSERIEELLRERGLLEGGLYEAVNTTVVHHANQALRAHVLYTRDKDYIVKDNEVVLIDEFTGRMMTGRRLSEGLHQAIEAKEQVPVQPENQTLASITFQNYFRLYEKLGGMTGTAQTEAAEFEDIYGLRVVEIPTNRPVARIDENDLVFQNQAGKHRAILRDIRDCYDRGQPILVGTASIEKSELISDLLKAENIPHSVLNAHKHAEEAEIVAEAGVPGAVTIATNMAGRGTDIQLGGNVEMRLDKEKRAREAAWGRAMTSEELQTLKGEIEADIAVKKAKALELGGLYVLGTERHESRRIDNQLRGRTGRQGDPGKSRFYISCDDDLLRIFGGDRLAGVFKVASADEDEPLEDRMMNKVMEISQKRVEARNFEIRKNLLKYDDVINDQRKQIFEERKEFMRTDNVEDTVRDMRHEVIDTLCEYYMPARLLPEQWDTEGLENDVRETLGLEIPAREMAAREGVDDNDIRQAILEASDKAWAEKVTLMGEDQSRYIEKQVLLQTIDLKWREHLVQVDHLRSVIHLRGYGQRDPLIEYKTDAFSMFEKMRSDLRTDVTRVLMNIQLIAPDSQQFPASFDPSMATIDAGFGSGIGDGFGSNPDWVTSHPAPATGLDEMGDVADDLVPSPLGDMPRAWLDTPRNAPCPCGSGKRFKACHGAV
ncbi:protein translocase subunit SecA [Candidatus Phycosocius bacilliformis]|uniref:Protein translocase subunit SecA n=1 Tax=Candidatus Phycosocius bacilliformis TaxID=1445552 RepID=A0A2P2EC00_9PROT|nr:preprotein translocase subunit SecA [Candidatus Phycosocius bacilliformis]GBF58571.1 protein translocase subunit SecA [Candidatus Phycosocius bacilliformis]